MPMHLYHLNLQKPTVVTAAVYGSFSAPKAQEVVVARLWLLELLKVDNNGHVVTIDSTHVFGTIRSLTSVRLPGTQQDYLVVGSDSGRITIVQFENTTWKVAHVETFGRTGCRRVVPGQYVVADPRGRAVMIGAVEKQKFVYVLNRDANNKLTISSPLEAHKSHSIVYSCCGVDVGFDNPVFACIEVDYSDLDEDPSVTHADKQLVYYELDLGLNHVLRKWSTPVDATSHLVIPVPGGAEGPSGVLVCSENYITYKHNTITPGLEVVEPIPRRADMPSERGLLVATYASYRQRGMFFFLIQTEYGDLFKVTLDCDNVPGKVRKIKVQYFDTIPVCNSLCVLRAGFLFAAAEFSNHILYQFQTIGDEDEDLIFGELQLEVQRPGEEDDVESLPIFWPRKLKNLLAVDEVHSLCPVLDARVVNLSPLDDKPQIYLMCGRGPNSTLRVLRHGLTTNELAAADLPGQPTRVWTIKKRYSSAYDDYIAVGFGNATLLLSIGEAVEEAQGTGFSNDVMSVHCGTLQDDSMVQVTERSIRHIRTDGRVTEWRSTTRITHGAQNASQLLIARGTELMVFELDMAGALVDTNQQDLGKEIRCIDVAPSVAGLIRAKFAVVGFADNTVRIYNLEQADGLQVPISRLHCKEAPDSVALVFMPSEVGQGQSLYLFTGLSNGVLQRCTLDATVGELRDPRSRLCGHRGCKLVKVTTQGRSSVLILSTAPWLCYFAHGHFNVTPLGQQDNYEHSAPFASEACPEGLITIKGNKMRILALERIGDSIFSQKISDLKRTPRKFAVHPQLSQLIILESDHRSYTRTGKSERKRDLTDTVGGEVPDFDEKTFGTMQAPAGNWSTFVRIYDPYQEKTPDLIELEENQAAVSLCMCQFTGYSNERFLVVGTAKDFVPNPKKSSGGALLTFKIVLLNGASTLELQHKTMLEEIPLALAEFQGRLLVGMGNKLLMFEMGRSKLLKKSERRNFPNAITGIKVLHDRIFVSDVLESVFFVKFRKSEFSLVVFADSFVPRAVSAFCVLDYNTVAIGDKFGNFTVLRLPQDAADDIEDLTTLKGVWDRGFLGGASQKAEEVAQFHVGDIITSIQRTSLGPAGAGTEVILYTTITGSIGAFVPLQTRDDADFFQLLQMHIREHNPPLCGRDQQAYRSQYWPIRDVIDGDFCEQFTKLAFNKQQNVAGGLERSAEEVCQRLEEIRHQIL